MDVDTEYKTIGKLFEKAKTSTKNFQQQFDKLKVQESILISLRDRYHEALATKKFHESERDTYFSHDKDTIEMRQNLLDQSIEILDHQKSYYKTSQAYFQNWICFTKT